MSTPQRRADEQADDGPKLTRERLNFLTGIKPADCHCGREATVDEETGEWEIPRCWNCY